MYYAHLCIKIKVPVTQHTTARTHTTHTTPCVIIIHAKCTSSAAAADSGTRGPAASRAAACATEVEIVDITLTHHLFVG